jgi:hypothetical protein
MSGHPPPGGPGRLDPLAAWDALDPAVQRQIAATAGIAATCLLGSVLEWLA